jgi:thiol-disulfide isomerase/thioredoxin
MNQKTKLKIILTLFFISAIHLANAQDSADAKTPEAAIDFTKPDPDGNMITLSKLRGKYVLIDFWGSWCGACRYGTPHIKELYAKYKNKGLEILGVSIEKSKDLAEAKRLWKNAIKEDGVPWLNVINNEADMKQNIPKLYQVVGYPTYILLDKEGNIIGRWLGSGGQGLDTKLAEIFK